MIPILILIFAVVMTLIFPACALIPIAAASAIPPEIWVIGIVAGVGAALMQPAKRKPGP